MRRREFIAFVGGTAVAWPLRGRAQQAALPVVGVVSGQSPHSDARNATAFYKGLSEAGYIDGQNVTVEYHWVEGHYDRNVGWIDKHGNASGLGHHIPREPQPLGVHLAEKIICRG